MYSMVLMMAMTTPAEAPSWGWRTGGCGGYSCYGSCVGVANGSGCAGSGCAGAGYGGGGGKWFGKWRGGCCGGGCWGSAGVACHGCGGCWGYGPIAYYGFAGCYGSCYGSYTNYFSYWSTPPNVHYGNGMPMHAAPPGGPMPPPGGAAPAVDPAKPGT